MPVPTQPIYSGRHRQPDPGDVQPDIVHVEFRARDLAELNGPTVRLPLPSSAQTAARVVWGGQP
ncbi:hypothetical protein FHR83_006632 [Actinoplanes campanulatus]|uniref:Uncharacterized protein n=1 Tax=Actinoplanes campanulatus TaxID=113559 RepID=A0A7W5AMC2_9ACTN|nr:hypothetical protein [Actinoplanes campanulatus]GGN39820.1 hypothetical protein GCM10010109_68240 [Actinoplanes campanulatus]GID40130.1 hypothetical protein Aca09nite_66360 [Actinoplanes campanulatus]